MQTFDDRQSRDRPRGAGLGRNCARANLIVDPKLQPELRHFLSYLAGLPGQHWIRDWQQLAARAESVAGWIYRRPKEGRRIMLVEMVRLREDGIKLTREQIRVAPVWRNELWMYRIDGTARAVFGNESNYLDPAAIMVMRGTSFLVVGLETVGKWGTQRKVPQAWWCRLVTEAKAAAPLSQELKPTPAIAEV